MPALTAERMTINQRAQIGLETTAGTDVAANILLEATEIEMGINLEVNPQRAMGRRFPRLATIGNEWQAWAFKGKPTFDEMNYYWANQFGNISPNTQGTLGKRWSYLPALTGPQSGNPFSIQQGDGVVRSQKVNFGMVTDQTLKITNKDNDFSGSGISHPLQDNITMTASPVVKAFQQISKPMWALYLDSTSLGIGTTQMLTPLDVEFNYGNSYGPLYAINRSGQYKNVVDLVPKASIKVLMEADAQGMTPLVAARLGSLQYIRLQAIGAQIENTWFLYLGSPSAGTFNLTYNAGNTTAGIAYNAAAATIATALTGLASVGGSNATVTPATIGGLAGFIVAFTGTLASVNTLPTYNPITGALVTGFAANGAGMTGGIIQPLTPTAFLCQYDLATVCTQIAKMSDSNGVYAIEYTFELFEDPNWTSQGQTAGQSSALTLINTNATY